MPNILIDIPFDIFRALKRTNQELYEKDPSLFYDGCLKGKTFQQEVGKFIVRHFYDPKIANPDHKEVMIIRLNGMLQYQDCISIMEADPFA